jgi:hypothetical protein
VAGLFVLEGLHQGCPVAGKEDLEALAEDRFQCFFGQFSPECDGPKGQFREGEDAKKGVISCVVTVAVDT